MADDKRDRRRADLLQGFDRNRFEQEVAEEIGISLENKRKRRAGAAASAPGASNLLNDRNRRGSRPRG